MEGSFRRSLFDIENCNSQSNAFPFSLLIFTATPAHIDAQAVKSDLKGIKGVKSIHDLHSKSSGKYKFSDYVFKQYNINQTVILFC